MGESAISTRVAPGLMPEGEQAALDDEACLINLFRAALDGESLDGGPTIA